MGKKGVIRKHPDIDFFVGFINGPEIPTKQDKFKPLLSSEYEVFKITEGGGREKPTDEDLYLKKKIDDRLKKFEEYFKNVMAASLKAEHPYTKDVPLEVIVSVSMDKKRLTEVDIDNLVKAILDCMNGSVYVDDTQIVNIYATKHVHPAIEWNSLMVGIRKLDKKQSWFKEVKLAFAEELQD